jgi:hypothetical protein
MGRMNIITGLSGLKSAAEMTKALRDGIKSGQIKADEIAGRIGEIYDYIIDSKAALVDTQEEVQALRAQIQSFNDEKEFRDSLTFDPVGIYRRKAPAGNDELYCSACLDEHNKRVRLTGGSPGKGFACCHIHGYRD